jgi:DNA repair protein RadA/Sms
MAKRATTEHACSGCGARTARWFGRCPQCGEFGTVAELPVAHIAAVPGRGGARAPLRPARPVGDVLGERTARVSSGVAEFDRVLGGGLVPGQVVLLAGEPGVGKSTLLLAVADAFARRVTAGQNRTVLYVSGEESVEQIGVRAQRTGAGAASLLVADEASLEVILGQVEATLPDLLVVDSVQTVSAADVDGRPGGISQVVAVTQSLTGLAKRLHIPVLLIGQSTRDNAVAGPRALEHLVDTVLTFEGERNTPIRLLRATKNRFGPAEEVVCFEQRDDGLAEVCDPSQLFRAHRDTPVPGTCVTVAMEGRRALLAEVQSLVGGTAANPRRMVAGLDSARVAMLIAVTERTSGERLSDKDVYVATVAGVRLTDPSADLAVCLAVASAQKATPLPADVLAIGEVALSGDIRPVHNLSLRLSEAARLGFRRVLVPRGCHISANGRAAEVTVVEVAHLRPALRALHELADKRS